MLYASALILLPVLLVFGLYHLNVWLSVPGIRDRPFWGQVAAASGEGHVLILVGIVALAGLDYRTQLDLAGPGSSFGVYLLTGTDFSAVMWLLDPLPMAILAVLVSLIPIAAGVIWAVTLPTLLLAGTLQWMAVGGVLAWAFGRLWGSLRTEGDDLPDWF
jgi:hypothetical protein